MSDVNHKFIFPIHLPQYGLRDATSALMKLITIHLALALLSLITILANEPIVSSIGLRMLPISAGEFRMGSPADEVGRSEDEEPTDVALTKDFFLAESEVTQSQWFAVMKTSIAQQIETKKGPVGRGAKLVTQVAASGEEQPMCFVSWDDALLFCQQLTLLDREQGLITDEQQYRLPSEAQWEYACRSGTTTIFSFGDQLSSTQANFYGKSPYGKAPEGPYRKKTTPVKSFPPNAWGLYDMHGNLYEWCYDFYHEKLPGGDDPLVTQEGEARVIRGGTWNRKGSSCRSAYRYSAYPYTRSHNIGFRVALITASPQEPTSSAPE